MTTEGRTTWHGFGWGPWAEDAEIPHEPLDEHTRAERELPRSLTAVTGGGVVQRPVFDPALKHYARAMRSGEPRFADEDVATRWHTARRQAIDHVLAAIAASPWAEHLVLRGSVLLRAWYGTAAREPGDLDFVVVPAVWEMSEPRTGRMFDAIGRDAEALSRAGGGVRIDAAAAVGDEIWTYDRVPGRRLVLPWHADGLPPGTVQLDFVFNETLPSAPEHTEIPRRGRPGAHRILAASPAQSLAWKLLWLSGDVYPQGKDLYDAVLLAESASLSAALLHATLVSAEPHWAGRRITREAFAELDVDWEEFAKEYPDVPGGPEEFTGRLLTALEPVFAEESGPPVDGYSWRVRLLAPLVEECRRLATDGGVRAVTDRLRAGNVRLTEGAVVLREVAGPEHCTLRDATALYIEHYPRSEHERAYYARNPDLVDRALAELREQV